MQHRAYLSQLTTIFFLAVAIVFCGLRLWLVEAQDLSYQGFSPHDDLLFIQLAQNIRDTGWLGPYSNLTLAKGPLYPIFLAVNAELGIPLLLSQNLLYIFAIAALSLSARPLLKHDLVTLVLFLLLLFQPASFEADANNRVIRASLSVSLALLTVAGVLRGSQSLSKFHALVLGPLTGLAFAAFWLTREDTVWLVPAVVFTLGGAWFYAFLHRRITLSLFTFTTGFFCFFLTVITFVMAVNAHFYQVFAITEFQHPAFPAAYGALQRVRSAQKIPYIPVNASTRYLLYSVSPTFQQLAYPMETWFAPGWAENSVELTGLPVEAKEIAGGWWMWALRDAVSAAGYYEKGYTAQQFYYQLANEVNMLCDSGKLICTGPHASMTPQLERADLEHIIPGYFTFFRWFFSSLHFSPYNLKSAGSADHQHQFWVISHEKLFQNENMHTDDLASAPLQQRKLRYLDAIASHYQQYVMLLVLPGIMLTVYLLLQRDPYALALTGIIGSAALLLLIVTIIHFTQFPAYGSLYMNPIYPLILFAGYVAIVRSFPYAKKQLLQLSLNEAKPRIVHKGFDDLSRIDLMSKD